MNAIRIWAVSVNSFREIIRERILYVVGIFALIMVAAWRILPEFAVSAQGKMMLDFGLAAASILGVVVAIFVGTNLINKEIDRKTILALVAKPLTRAEFIIGKHFGLSAVLAVMVAAMMAIYLGMLSLAKIPYQTTPLLTTGLFLFLELMVLVAAALLFGSITSSLLATLMTVLVYLAGHGTQEMIKMTNGNNLMTGSEGIRKISDVLFMVVPDLSRLDLKNDAVYGVLPSSQDLWVSAGYAFVYTAIFLVVTIGIFSRRQF
jgi:ABC-type transport system involved in multi-copper enzyme maturation permease subunit